MNFTLKNIRHRVCELINRRSELARRRRMEQSPEELRQFVQSLPNLSDSSILIREDRER